MESKASVGRIAPMVFSSERLAGAFAALADAPTPEPADVTRSEAEQMANAAQSLWDLLRAIDMRRLDRIEEIDPELGASLADIRAAMR